MQNKMVDFKKTLAKLQSNLEPKDYVSDNYGQNDIATEVSDASMVLNPEDIHKILNAESSGGKNLQNPDSSAKGNFQFIDSTRKAILDDLKNNQNVEIPVNPDRQDALLMKNQLGKYENALLNSKTGPKDLTLENIDLMHKYGIQGGLNALNDPNSELSKIRFKDIKNRMNKKPLPTNNDTLPAKNLLDLIKE